MHIIQNIYVYIYMYIYTQHSSDRPWIVWIHVCIHYCMCTYPCVSVYIFLLTNSRLSDGCQEDALRVYFAMCPYLQSVILANMSLIFEPLLISKWRKKFFIVQKPLLTHAPCTWEIVSSHIAFCCWQQHEHLGHWKGGTWDGHKTKQSTFACIV